MCEVYYATLVVCSVTPNVTPYVILKPPHSPHFSFDVFVGSGFTPMAWYSKKAVRGSKEAGGRRQRRVSSVECRQINFFLGCEFSNIF